MCWPASALNFRSVSCALLIHASVVSVILAAMVRSGAFLSSALLSLGRQWHVAAQVAAREPPATPVKPARHIRTKPQSYAGCRDMAGTRQPVAGSGHFDRLDIMSQCS